MREVLSIYFLHSLLIARSYDDGGECGSGDDGGDASVDGVSVVAPLEVPMHLHLRRRPHIGLGFVRSVMMMMMMVMAHHDYQ